MKNTHGQKITPDPKKDTIRLIMVSLAALVMACNICIFVNAGGLFPGGATGITVLNPHPLHRDQHRRQRLSCVPGLSLHR